MKSENVKQLNDNNKSDLFIIEALHYLAEESLRQNDLRLACVIQEAIEIAECKFKRSSPIEVSPEDMEQVIDFLRGFLLLTDDKKQSLVDSLNNQNTAPKLLTEASSLKESE